MKGIDPSTSPVVGNSEKLGLGELLERVRLLATDLDGTLLGDGGLILPETKQAWRLWSELGGSLVVITGRPFTSLLQVLTGQDSGEKWPFPDAVVCEERDAYLHEGAGSWQPLDESGAALARERALLEISSSVAEKLIARGVAKGYEVKRSTESAEWERGYVELRFPNKLEAERARLWVTPVLGGRPLVPVRNGRLMSLRHKDFRKGPALQRLTAHLGLAPNQILAVGDSHNDLSMLDGTYGFLSATVANADEEILRAVGSANGILTPHRSSLGVAWLLEALVACQSEQGVTK